MITPPLQTKRKLIPQNQFPSVVQCAYGYLIEADYLTITKIGIHKLKNTLAISTVISTIVILSPLLLFHVSP